jgi:hypothetical protein
MPDELQELRENAEHGRESPSLAPVTITMAVLAVLVAAVSLSGHRAHTEEILLQTKSSDQWAYYQAKNIRRQNYELFLDELSIFSLKDSEQTNKIREKYAREVERYGEEQKEIQDEARKLESEVAVIQRRANRFDLGEVVLEAALVIVSLTLLTRRRVFWIFGSILAVLGIAVAATGFLIR